MSADTLRPSSACVGAAAPTQAEDGRNVSADIDNLAREVTEHVTRELELRRERRQEDPDGRNIWW